MTNRITSLNSYKGLLALTLSALLVGCGGNYQAPVAERGERLVVSAPLIVDSSTDDSRLRVVDSRAAVTSSVSPSRPVNVAPGQGDASVSSHRVRAGDTLFSIAFQYDLDFRSLAIANGLNPPYTIFVDSVLNLDINSINQVSAGIATGSLGTAVGRTVATSQAGNVRSGRVLRQPISSNASRGVEWQWPSTGRLLRGFQAGVNKGLDIAGSYGDPVLAAGDGDVVYSGRGVQGTGDLIIIRHSDRYLSAYAHNSTMLVSEGSRVRAGEKIAEIGESPSGVAMLHFEIREDGNSINPSKLLPRR
ncbi:MAG: hypothetical protein COA96_05495 [SAR86 cluster bacterium]|uniref:LysM domain-containing protein n=1 Tax=SAR86 cluster bacterium TaxID=2030880 RepID=A0A2A5B4Q7_9GAMM|nr:MAG: hypothetical protein COA96_05495 [SAR86 cluster bacterium]